MYFFEATKKHIGFQTDIIRGITYVSSLLVFNIFVFQNMDTILILILTTAGLLTVAATVVDPQEQATSKIRRHTVLERVNSSRGRSLERKYVLKLKTRATSRREELVEEERGVICFGELGCFSNGHPFDSPSSERVLSYLPEVPEAIGTEFRFYAPKRNGYGQFVRNKNFSNWDIEDSGFNASSKTKFIIHGYLGGDAIWAVDLKQALILKEKCNVFIVDWSDGDGIMYEQAVANVRVVGAEVGLFIKKLMNATGLLSHMIHIIGHSLGAHGAGYAGKFVQKNIPKAKIGRISGLDPAGPYFEGVDPEVRLDAGDAKFVDVIHTNAAEHRLSGFGLWEPIGHFDFYPSGGEDQPGCPSASLSYLTTATNAFSCMNLPCLIYQATKEQPFDFLIENINDVSCSHGRAYEYFIESVKDRDCEFRSLPCSSYQRFIEQGCGNCRENDCISMGYYADRYTRHARGQIHKKLYLRNIKFPPFCLEKTNFSHMVNA